MNTVHEKDFPFIQLKTPTGDYYDNRTEMALAGFQESQMWSIVEADADDGTEYLVYGPVHHYVNLIGYVATAEHHDSNTYYNECVKTAQEVANEAAYYCEACDD